MNIIRSNASHIPLCQDMITEAGDNTGLPADWRECTTDALAQNNVLLSMENGKPTGYFAFMLCNLPDTQERVMIERMLYVRLHKRSGTTAMRLIKAAEVCAKAEGCVALLAGSSLQENALTRRLYEARGYKTNFTFRKEL